LSDSGESAHPNGTKAKLSQLFHFEGHWHTSQLSTTGPVLHFNWFPKGLLKGKFPSKNRTIEKKLLQAKQVQAGTQEA